MASCPQPSVATDTSHHPETLLLAACQPQRPLPEAITPLPAWLRDRLSKSTPPTPHVPSQPIGGTLVHTQASKVPFHSRPSLPCPPERQFGNWQEGKTLESGDLVQILPLPWTHQVASRAPPPGCASLSPSVKWSQEPGCGHNSWAGTWGALRAGPTAEYYREKGGPTSRALPPAFSLGSVPQQGPPSRANGTKAADARKDLARPEDRALRRAFHASTPLTILTTL